MIGILYTVQGRENPVVQKKGYIVQGTNRQTKNVRGHLVREHNVMASSFAKKLQFSRRNSTLLFFLSRGTLRLPENTGGRDSRVVPIPIEQSRLHIQSLMFF